MNLPVLSHINTINDKKYLLNKLDQLERSTFSVKTTLENSLHEQFSLTLAEAIIETAKSENIDLADSSGVQKLLQDIQSEINALPQVTIVTSISLSDDILRIIAKWFDTEIGTRMIVENRVEPSLIGGAVIELNGKYLDYSLKKLISEKLKGTEEQKNNIQAPNRK